MPIPCAGIASQLDIAPHWWLVGSVIAAIAHVAVAVVKHDTPVTRAIAELLRRRRNS